MDKTVVLAKDNNVSVGAHPSLPDHQGFGRREMAIEPVCVYSYVVDCSLSAATGRTHKLLHLSSRSFVWLLAQTRSGDESRSKALSFLSFPVSNAFLLSSSPMEPCMVKPHGLLI